MYIVIYFQGILFETELAFKMDNIVQKLEEKSYVVKS